MPLLSFQIQADYDKVIRLRSEIEKLKSEMKSVNAVFDADRFNSYNKRLKEATTEFNALVDSAAKAGAKVNSSVQAMSRTVDLSNPTKELKKFDGQVDELCKHLNAYFDFLKGKLQDTLNMLNEVGSIADKVNVDDKNVGHIEELKRQNAELTSEIQRQIAAYEEQQSRFQALSDAIRTNNVPAFQQLAEQEDEASKRLKLDEARNSLKGVTDDMKSLAAQMAETQGDVERLESLLDSLKNSHLDDGNAIKDSQYLETEQALESAREKLVGMKKEYNEMAILQKQYSDQVQQTNGHQERLRTQIMNAREDMVKLIAAGQAGTPTFNEIVSQTGKMRRELALANAYMQYFADPNRNLATLKQSMEGAAGGASLLVGVMGLFNQKSEEMEMIQTKLQSLLGIIVGLETTYAAVKKTSNVMIAIGQIQSWASAKAKAAETVATDAGTVATIKATAAQAMFNTVAKANPYLALLSIITLVVGSIYTLAKAFGSETDEQKKAAEATKEHAEEIRKQHEAWAHSVANSAAKQIMSYKNLQKKWEELGNDLKAKEKFVTDNKTAFNDLGFSVDNVTQAENLLIKNTDAVVNAIMARAKAAAYEKVATEELERQIRIELEKGTVANGAYRKNFKKGQRLSLDEARELEKESGVSLVGTNSTSTKGVAFSTDVEVTNENVLNNAAKKAAENRRKRYQADRAKRIQESKDKVKLIQDNARQEYEAEKAAIKQTGVPQFTPTKTNSHNGGNTSDRLHAIMDKQKLDEQRRAIDLEFSTREAQIKAMQDGTDKVLAQIELDRDREEEAIRRSYEDMRLKRIEEARKVWEADPKNKGKNFYDTQEYAQANTNTQEETDNRDARMKAALAQYNKSLEEQRRQEVQAMYDYLQEYGTYQQKKLAIAEEYAAKIAEANKKGDKWTAKKLEAESKSKQAAIDTQALKQNIDWQAVLGGFTGMLGDQLKNTLANLKEYVRTPEFSSKNETDQQVIYQAIEKLQGLMGGGKGTLNFSAIKQQMNDLGAAVNRLQQAKNQEYMAYENLKKAQTAYQKAMETGTKAQQNEAKSRLELAQKVADSASSQVQVQTTAVQNLATNLKESEQDTVNGLNMVADGLKGFADGTLSGAFNGIQNMLNGLSKLNIGGKVGEAINSLSETLSSAGFIGQLISAILSILDILKDGIGTLISNLIDTVFNAINGILSNILSLDFIGQIGGSLISGVGNVLNTVTFGGFDSLFGIGGNEAEVAETTERLTKENEELRKSVDRLKDAMDNTSGLKAINNYEHAYQMQEKANRNLFEILDSQMGYWSAHHSNNYYADDDVVRSWQSRLNALFREHRDDYGRGSVGDLDLSQGIGAFYNLASPEQLAIIRDYAGDIWRYLTEVGKYDKSEYWENAADAAGKLQEITHSLYENLTQMNFDTLRDNFLSSLMDMSTDWDDTLEGMMDDFEEMFRKASLNFALSSTNEELRKFWEDWGERMKNGTELTQADIDYYRTRYKALVEEGLKERERIAQLTGYDGNDDKEQSATANGIEKITHEDAGVIEGRLTATQIAVEQGNTKKDAIIGQMTIMNVTMSDIRSVATGMYDIADDTRNILANSYLELREANDHLGKIEKAVGNIQTIAEDTKKIVDDRL